MHFLPPHLRSLALTGLVVVGLAIASAPALAQTTRTSDEPTMRAMGVVQAIASEVLRNETSGFGPRPPAPVPPPDPSLTVDSDFVLGGHIFQNGAPWIHNYGGFVARNTAVGLWALEFVSPSESYLGNFNTAIGQYALRFNSDGFANTAVGMGAMGQNTMGAGNIAVGPSTLYFNTEGSGNVAMGIGALLYNEGSANIALGTGTLQNATTSDNNVGVGHNALYASTGSGNTAVGYKAGNLWGSGDFNIALGAGAAGTGSETGTIRIGGAGYQAYTFIEGIRDAIGSYAFDQAVCTNQEDQLGPCDPDPTLGASRLSSRFEALLLPTGRDTSSASLRRELSRQEKLLKQQAEQIADLRRAVNELQRKLAGRAERPHE